MPDQKHLPPWSANWSGRNIFLRPPADVARPWPPSRVASNGGREPSPSDDYQFIDKLPVHWLRGQDLLHQSVDGRMILSRRRHKSLAGADFPGFSLVPCPFIEKIQIGVRTNLDRS